MKEKFVTSQKLQHTPLAVLAFFSAAVVIGAF
jgi:hypothetical protein